MSLNISHLQLIQTLVEEHTLTRTAQRLHLTQSALSHQLRNLEESLGIEIFHRLGKRMQLTQAGERLLRTAQTVLTELQSVEEDIRKLTEGRTGAIRFSTECYTCYHWLPPLIERYRRHFPQIDVQIVAEATQRPGQALLDGRLDLAIMHNPEQNDRVQYHPLFQNELVAIVPPDHPFAERKPLQPADFAVCRLITIFCAYQQESIIVHNDPVCVLEGLLNCNPNLWETCWKENIKKACRFPELLIIF